MDFDLNLVFDMIANAKETFEICALCIDPPVKGKMLARLLKVKLDAGVSVRVLFADPNGAWAKTWSPDGLDELHWMVKSFLEMIAGNLQDFVKLYDGPLPCAVFRVDGSACVARYPSFSTFPYTDLIPMFIGPVTSPVIRWELDGFERGWASENSCVPTFPKKEAVSDFRRLILQDICGRTGKETTEELESRAMVDGMADYDED